MPAEKVAPTLSPKEQAEADLRARIDAYVMPKPPKGSAVLWYPHGLKTEAPEVGFANKIGHRNLVVALIGGVFKETVRHIDDPKLTLNAAQRENGAWDFTDETKERIALRSEIGTLRDKVAELEDLIVGKKK